MQGILISAGTLKIKDTREGIATYEGTGYKELKEVPDKSVKCGMIDSQHDVGGWPELKSLPAPKDSDHDGMPDEWELDNNLDPDDASDGTEDSDGDGYTNVEEYINGLVDSKISF